MVIAIAGHRLADGLGGLARPLPGDELTYDIVREGAERVTVRIDRQAAYPLLVDGWGNLVFVVSLAALATALYVRRPEEPSTTPLLITAAGLLGSTLSFVAGVPALALATGGPVLWLYNACIIGVYSIAWGAGLAFAVQLPRDDVLSRARASRARGGLRCSTGDHAGVDGRGRGVRTERSALVRSRVRRHDGDGRGKSGDRRGTGCSRVPAQSRRIDPEQAAMGGWRQRRRRVCSASSAGIYRS